MGIKRYSAAYRSTNECDEGLYVLHEDHVASHAYDEAKEREMFEAFWSENMNLLEMDLHRHIYPMNSGWSYACHETNRSWMTWQACAKSHARSAE